MNNTNNISLRTLEPSDLDFLLNLENDTDNWFVSQTRVPFSKKILSDYIDSAQDIFLTKQIRFVICLNETKNPIGTIDLFDYDPINQRAGVGIILTKKYRNKGYATEALNKVIAYCFKTLLLQNIYCNILTTNLKSIALFKNCGFTEIGVKKNWYKTSTGWEHEALFQLTKK